MQRRAFICGLSGPSLSADERDFLNEMRPAGIILFARNTRSPGQVRSLIADAVRAASGDGWMLVMVDQEGGRVQRLSAPHWPRYAPARAFGTLRAADPVNARQSAHLSARLMADDLRELGFNTSCAPVLDVPVPGADAIIGDRAYGEKIEPVIELGSAVASGLLAGGILPVMKHIPGHGRAMADSHLALPVTDAPLKDLQLRDFAPFRALRHLPMAMTAHVVFSAIDPAAPITVSKKAIEPVIRGAIGFEGLLITDDLSMRALSGPLAQRARAAFEAGCDLALHCNGTMEEMVAVAAASPTLEGGSLHRFETALAHLSEPEPFDREAAEQARLDSLAAMA